MQKLLIADATEEFCLALKEATQDIYHVRLCHDGIKALQLLLTFQPDILVLDLLLPGLDGLTVLQRGREAGLRPIVLAITKLPSDYVEDAARAAGVDYLMIKPCETRAAITRIHQLAAYGKRRATSHPPLRKQVTDLLIWLGVATRHQGFDYVREGIIAAFANPTLQLTKHLYPSIAKICNCDNPDRVEHSIRTAILAAWKKRDEQRWRNYFPLGPDGTVPKPTNGEFIKCLATHLQMQMEDTV